MDTIHKHLNIYRTLVYAQLCLILCNPSRLLCPWDSPGKNTALGCHFLLQGSSHLRDQTCVSSLAGGFFTTEPPGKPRVDILMGKRGTVWAGSILKIKKKEKILHCQPPCARTGVKDVPDWTGEGRPLGLATSRPPCGGDCEDPLIAPSHSS